MSVDRNMALRHTFVGMLFALAIAQAAIFSGDLFKVVTYGWHYHISIDGLIERLTAENNLLLAPATHLFLGILLVAQSWVGWSKSRAGGNKRSVDDIYGLPFFLLIIEVLLVVLYFILISSVELSVADFKVTKKLSDAIPNPSAAPEAGLLLMVFLVYALWDLVSDVLLGPIPNEHRPIKERRYLSKVITLLTGVVTYCCVSLICAFLAWQIQMKASIVSEPSSAIWGDFALIALLYFFRTAKYIECLFIRLFNWESKRPGVFSSTGNAYKSVLAMVIPLAFIFIFLCLM